MPYRILFYGTPEYSVPTLQSLISDSAFEVVAVVTQPDRPAGRGKKLQFSPVKTLALCSDIPVLQPENIRKSVAEFSATVTELGPIDAAVVIAYGQIIPEAVLKIPAAGSINLHASLLPRWRGAAPIQRSIIAGDTTTGVSVMQMQAGLDDGPFYLQETVPITAESDGKTLHDQLSMLSANLTIGALAEIINRELPATEQNSALVTYAHKLTKDDELLDRSKPAAELERIVRALAPSPGAYLLLGDLRVKVLRAKIVDSETEPEGSAEFALLSKNRIILRTATKGLELLTVQLAGKNKMPVSEFLKGNFEHLNKL